MLLLRHVWVDERMACASCILVRPTALILVAPFVIPNFSEYVYNNKIVKNNKTFLRN